MVFVVTLKALFVMLVVLGAFAPYLARQQRRSGAVVDTRVDAGGGQAPRLLDPIADLIKLLSKEDVTPTAAHRGAYLLAPVLVTTASLAVFAVIPFGGVYRFGATTLTLVVANLDWGLLYVLALGVLASLGTALAGWSCGTDRALASGLRASTQALSYGVLFGVSLLASFMVFETLRTTELAIAQDTIFHPIGVVADRTGYALPRGVAWLAAVPLPKWGIFVQPVGFAISLIALMAMSGRPPFDGSNGAADGTPDLRGGFSGMRSGLFGIADAVGVVAIAAIVVTVYLGGGSVPYLSQQRIIAGVGSFFGTGFATAVCIAVHVASFLVKVAAVIRFQLALSSALPRYVHGEARALCWKSLFPLAVVNTAATGLAILLIEGMR